MVPANHNAAFDPFCLSPSLCLRRVPVVLLNTVTAITIGILQKILSFPLRLNPIWGLFVRLIKATKNGSASHSGFLITYLRDRDDMRTGSRGEKMKQKGENRTQRSRWAGRCQDGLSPRHPEPLRPRCSSLCWKAEVITCFPSLRKAHRSVPTILKRRLTARKQTYEETLRRENCLSIHLCQRQ